MGTEKWDRIFHRPPHIICCYYTYGSGVVALNKERASHQSIWGKASIAGTTVHELRHAWQDRYGMFDSNNQRSFHETLTINRLVEADAWAHGDSVAKDLQPPSLFLHPDGPLMLPPRNFREPFTMPETSAT